MAGAALALLFLVGTTAHAVSVTVPGTANPWLAGMPDGSVSNVGTPEAPDVAPDQSPVQVIGLPIIAGDAIRWTAAGSVHHGPGVLRNPDGDPNVSLPVHLVGAENGMSDINAPVTSLLGVFLGPDQPDDHPAPIALDFGTPLSRDYATLSPLLQQVFFMGDGLTSAALAQSVIVPAGATRLYLGVMDGYGWANNEGNFDVRFRSTGVPDAGATLSLLSMALIGLGWLRRK